MNFPTIHQPAERLEFLRSLCAAGVITIVNRRVKVEKAFIKGDSFLTKFEDGAYKLEAHMKWLERQVEQQKPSFELALPSVEESVKGRLDALECVITKTEQARLVFSGKVLSEGGVTEEIMIGGKLVPTEKVFIEGNTLYVGYRRGAFRLDKHLGWLRGKVRAEERAERMARRQGETSAKRRPGDGTGGSFGKGSGPRPSAYLAKKAEKARKDRELRNAMKGKAGGGGGQKHKKAA